MFVNAFSKASSYTRPVVISHINVKNKCSAGIGSYVIINSEGWAVTAAHIVKEASKLNEMVDSFHKTQKEKEDIKNNLSIDKHTRAKLLKSFTIF